MTKLYIQLFSRLLLVVGGGIFAYRAFTGVDPFANNRSTGVLVLFGAIALAAVLNGFNRDFYLPFLGQTVMPTPQLSPIATTNEVDGIVKSMTVTDLPPNSVVIFWGAEESEQAFEDPLLAYGEYTNSYVTKSDANGVAVAKLKCPSEYSVTKYGIFKTKLPRHIHYRYELPEYKGMFSRVFTKDLDETCQ